MAVDLVDGLEVLELQLQSTERHGSVNEKWLLLLLLFVAVRLSVHEVDCSCTASGAASLSVPFLLYYM